MSRRDKQNPKVSAFKLGVSKTASEASEWNKRKQYGGSKPYIIQQD